MKKPVPALIPFLVFVSVVFIGILILRLRRNQEGQPADDRGGAGPALGCTPPVMTCTLCGLDSGSSAFCCAGCDNVYAILLESGVLASGQNFRDTELFQQSLRWA